MASDLSTRERVAVILSGGGARGAYEAGVLSVLLPALEAAGQRPTIYVGSSAGAINAAAFASLQHLDAESACAEALNIWRKITTRNVFLSPGKALRATMVRRIRRTSAPGALLNTAPLTASLSTLIHWDRLHANIAEGLISSLGIVGTTWTSMRTTVFLEQAPGRSRPANDEVRAIDYVPTRLAPDHVLASSSIPVVFPPVPIAEPAEAADWYLDGGIRLNTPIKPALKLGAERVIVIATAPATAPRWNAATGANAPGLGSAGARLLATLLDDRMLEDLRTLAKRNEESTAVGQPGPDQIPWLFVGPSPDQGSLFARSVGEILQGTARSDGGSDPKGLARMGLRILGWATGRDTGWREILSHLFFSPIFAESAIQLGQRDARQALNPEGAPRWCDSKPSLAKSADFSR